RGHGQATSSTDQQNYQRPEPTGLVPGRQDPKGPTVGRLDPVSVSGARADGEAIRPGLEIGVVRPATAPHLTPSPIDSLEAVPELKSLRLREHGSRVAD